MLRAREAHMLTGETAGRMIDAQSFDDAAKMLAECGYPDMSGMDAVQLEAVLSKHRAEIFEELNNILPEKEVADLFRIRFDYHNAKVLIKSEGAGTDGANLLSGSGRIAPEALAEAYRSEDFARLPQEFANAIAEARSVLQRTENPQLADFILDRAYFTELTAAAERVYSPFVRAYVAALADSVNINAAVRTLRMGKDTDFLRRALVPGGSRAEDTIAASAASGEGIEALFKGTVFEDAAQKGAHAVGGGSLTEFELACDNAVSRFLSDSRFIGFGSEIVVSYLASLEGEITSVRMILTGKLSGVKPEKLRERLRDSYA
jgi:V/A-type H+-transporting ATPase subunit C